MDTITTEHIDYILNDWNKMKSLDKLKESDIDSIVDQNVKILLLTYYNYLDKLKSFDLIQLQNAKSNNNDNIYILAAFLGQIETMKLLEAIGLYIYNKNNDGNDVYLAAVSSGQLEVIEFL
jgi:ankyrin repeat protein